MKILRFIFERPYLTLLWAAVILVLTLTPAADMPNTPAWKLLSFDTAAHAGVFAVLAALAWPWVRRWSAHPAWLVLLGCVGLGALIEVLQYFMRLGRHAEWSDLLSDSLGAALVLGLIGLGQLGRRRLATTTSLLLAALAAHAQPSAPAPDAPDLARARRTIAALAAEKMHGRGYVQGGEHLAAAYLRGQFRQLGLQPLAPGYTQPFTLDVNTFPGKLQLKLWLASTTSVGATPREVTLRPGLDFIAAPDCPSIKLTTYYLDQLDTLALHNNPQALLALQLQGRLDAAHQTALLLPLRAEAKLAQLAQAGYAARYVGSQHPHLEVVPKLTASLAARQDTQPRLQVLASSLPAWAGHFDSRVTIQVDAQLLRNYQTQNLAAVVRGSTQPDSFVVVTAHYDHLGTMGKNAYFPGANDNASGVALLLELAAHYAQPANQPACSVAFVLFGAEEAGLVGSAYFVAHPLLPLARIKFLVNLDLLGTGEEGATVVNGRVYEAAYQHLTALNATHHYLPKLTARGRAANSDHYPFSEAGVPAFFVYTRGGSLAYHDVNDQPPALSLAGFAGAYGLVRDFLNAEGAAPRR